jgi:tol-pal system protein YbgF
VLASNPADEQISYLAAYELVKNKKYDDALSAMQNFVAKYPQGGYTANAHYWLGELYMVKKDYSEAIKHFDIVLEQFPSSSKCSASMLKIGYALAASGKTTDARTKLLEVLKKYPDTSTAELASTKLQSLGG